MDYRFPGEKPAAGHVPNQGTRGCWGAHVIRREPPRFVPRCCRLRGQDFERHSARRPARAAADQVRPDRQPQDRESTWAHDPGTVPSACRRGDRVKRREFITLLGGAAASVSTPLPLFAQEAGRIYRIGFVSAAPREEAWYTAFFEELRGLGFVEGQNLTVISGRFGVRNELLGEVAAALVRAAPDAIVAAGPIAARAAQAATT